MSKCQKDAFIVRVKPPPLGEVLPEGWLHWTGHSSKGDVAFWFSLGQLHASEFDLETRRFLQTLGERLGASKKEACLDVDSSSSPIVPWLTAGLALLVVSAVVLALRLSYRRRKAA